jgi:predicted transposase YbfD/YdcC
MPLPLVAVFADVPDPRRDTENKLHLLTDILTIATCAIIAGADGWEQIAAYGAAKEEFFGRFLELPNGIPSHDTFGRVFAKLDPDAFSDRFGRWMASACEATGLVQVAIDGKSARRSPKGTFTGCLHLVEAWAVENRLILGMRSVPEGGHEITTIPDLLGALDLAGALVTIDAAGCQKATVAQIREQGGDYLVCVKGNQKGLRDAVADVFARAGEAVRRVRHGRGGECGARARGGALRHGDREPRGAAGRLDGRGRGGAGMPRAVGGRESGREHGPLLHHEPSRGRGHVGGLHPQPLGHRERAPLGARCVVPRRREPHLGRPRRC